MKYLVQAIAYAAFAAVVGAFSVWPAYELLGAERAIVSLTFSHAGTRIGECRTLSQEELNELPPNMRKPQDCPRQRHPITVEFRADDAVVYRATLPPSGIQSDGKSTVYQRVEIEAGVRHLYVGMNESGQVDRFDIELETTETLSPGQNLVIDFDELQQRFVLR